MRVLAGDIGGTHARLALVDIEAGRAVIHHRHDYSSPEYPGLAPIVQEYLVRVGERPDRACFGVPCPITEGTCELTNLHWVLEIGALRREIGIPSAFLLNDFAAQGLAIPLLGPDGLAELKPGVVEARGPIGLLGAGTGLGQGALVWAGDRYQVVPSEGGHVDYAPRTDREIRLLQWLRRRHHRVSWERVLSGPGIGQVYRFLAEEGEPPESPAVRAQLEAGDPAAVVVGHALAGDDPLCVATMELFVSAYGAQAGNVALAYRATGGLYLAGGIAPRILPLLRGGQFLTAFLDKGRLSPMLARVPVQVIVHDAPGILGAARAASES